MPVYNSGDWHPEVIKYEVIIVFRRFTPVWHERIKIKKLAHNKAEQFIEEPYKQLIGNPLKSSEQSTSTR